MENEKEKLKRRKRVVALRKPRDYTGKAFLLLFAGAMLPLFGFALCIYYLWEALRLQYQTGTMQKGLIWLILVTIISGAIQVTFVLPFLVLMFR